MKAIEKDKIGAAAKKELDLKTDKQLNLIEVSFEDR
jgi:hypothetical protein